MSKFQLQSRRGTLVTHLYLLKNSLLPRPHREEAGKWHPTFAQVGIYWANLATLYRAFLVPVNQASQNSQGGAINAMYERYDIDTADCGKTSWFELSFTGSLG